MAELPTTADAAVGEARQLDRDERGRRAGTRCVVELDAERDGVLAGVDRDHEPPRGVAPLERDGMSDAPRDPERRVAQCGLGPPQVHERPDGVP